jgi:peptide/nickel transport system substrate-binding protein
MKFRSSAAASRPAFARAALAGAGAAVIFFSVLTLAIASTRPRYGGTLRVELRERVTTLDPRVRPAEAQIARAQEELDALVFDRLLRLDDQGRVAPALAVTWQSDGGDKRWQFELRPGVQFSDGTPLTAEIAAAALAPVVASEFGSDARVSGAGELLTIESAESMPGLPQEMATGRNFIFRVAADGTLGGTGPFIPDHWNFNAQPAQATFAANARCWAGRPFVDRVTVTLGVDSTRIEADLEFGLADAGELAPAEMRLAAERGVRTWSSQPMDLFVLAFDSERLAAQDALLREAIAAAIDRNAIANVVLQRQAIAAGALLPDWISGYAFLFPAGPPSAVKTGATAVRPTAPLVLVYDSQDAEARAVTERVVVDLRAAGVAAEAVAAGTQAADARVARIPIAQPDPSAALAYVLAALARPGSPVASAAASDADPESQYAAERAALADFRVVPLAHESENWGLGAALRDWMAPRWGDLRLADAWLDLPAAANTQ